MTLLTVPIFDKTVKKLHSNEKKELDFALGKLIENPLLGEQKKGDLAFVRVYKFKMIQGIVLLAYNYDAVNQEITLLSLGRHENFYRDLKNK